MKKFLLSLAAVVLGISASAETYTIDLSTVAPSDPSNFTAQGFSFTADNNKGTKPAYNAGSKDLRLYANNLFTITAPAGVNITAIDFALSNQGKTRQSTVAVNTGTMTQSAGVCTWAGAANAITYTVGAKADLSEADKTKAGQFCFTSLTITTNGAVTAKDPANLKFAQSEVTVNLGEAVPANDLSRDTDAAPVFSSSDAAVATVDAATGAVTVVAAGTTIITATTEATEDFDAGTASYTLTVVDPTAAGNTIYENSCMADDCGFTFQSGEVNPWTIDSRYGLKASAFTGGAAQESSGWAISPVLDLTDRVAPITMTFEHAVNQFKLNGNLINVADVVNYVQIDAATTEGASWDFLTDITVPESFSWNYYTETVDLSKFAGQKVRIAFLYKSTTEIAGTWVIKNVKVTATKKGGKADAALSFEKDAIKANLGEAVPANALTKATTAAVTYTSSNPGVATVDATTGAVTLVAAGETTITATAAENDQYLAGTASYTLTVVDAFNVIFEDACTDEATCKFQFLSLEEFNPWKIDATYGLKASAYVSGAAKASSAFAYVELDLTGRVAPIELAFEHAVNQFRLNGAMIDPSQLKDYCHIQIATNGLNEEDDDIIDLPVPEKFSWNFIPVKVDLSKYAGKKVTLGFHYESTEEIAGTWEIKNVKVTGLSGVNDVIAEDADAPVVYYNLQGVRVDNPANGLYIRVQGKKATKVLVR